jgi:uncharacterized protein YeaO (DUF488 family)
MTSMGTSPAVRVARIYEPPADHGGTWVLVDRLWPRGLRKDGSHAAILARLLSGH